MIGATNIPICTYRAHDRSPVTSGYADARVPVLSTFLASLGPE